MLSNAKPRSLRKFPPSMDNVAISDNNLVMRFIAESYQSPHDAEMVSPLVVNQAVGCMAGSYGSSAIH